VSFNLPGAASTLEPKVHVAWMDEKGRAGLRFIDVSKESRAQLDAWLAGQSEKMEKPAK
jgi:hypothetical protein